MKLFNCGLPFWVRGRSLALPLGCEESGIALAVWKLCKKVNSEQRKVNICFRHCSLRHSELDSESHFILHILTAANPKNNHKIVNYSLFNYVLANRLLTKGKAFPFVARRLLVVGVGELYFFRTAQRTCGLLQGPKCFPSPGQHPCCRRRVRSTGVLRSSCRTSRGSVGQQS